MEPWQLSIIVGVMTFIGLSINNKMTNNPNEVCGNAFILKASMVPAASILLLTFLTGVSKGSLSPSEQILTKFD
tara:strand:- start:85 stop:306 length:222 start_codon:yes stop_codon:yes gene_type:complete